MSFEFIEKHFFKFWLGGLVLGLAFLGLVAWAIIKLILHFT